MQDETTFKSGLEIVFVALGVIVPVIIVLFNRIIKENEKKMDKLFELCDKSQESIMENTVRIAQLGIEIESIKEIIYRRSMK